MIDAIITFSIRHRALVIATGIVLAALGAWGAWETPVDAIPDLSENQLIVVTEWKGHGPREIEDQVREWLFGGLPQIEELRAEYFFRNRSLLLDQFLSHLPRRHGEIADFPIATSHKVGQSGFDDIPVPDPIQAAGARPRLAVRTWDQIAQNMATVHLLEREVIGKRLEQIGTGFAFGNDPAPSNITGVAGLHLGKQR